MDRNKLFQDPTRENKGPQTILAGTCHTRLSAIVLTLKNNLHLISNYPKFSRIFKQKAPVNYRKNNSLSNYLLKIDITNQQLHSNVALCTKWKLWP